MVEYRAGSGLGVCNHVVVFGNDVGADVVACDVAAGFKHVKDGVDAKGEDYDERDLVALEAHAFKDHEEEEDGVARNAACANGG